ncbi:FBP domain-containing protein [Cellulomonas sp. S1-8]|uniref:FBP domain-containing protein n=1 Tax=Cellulomonas sp. S1-8 TaxID=2904790 RepID=UPI002244B266|nr:FBP domain-containing protein [Cellulomonas sp. S1-8]UZN05309.1 FBP domain-containing protein [Cellulomonas sp. S1-8]
MTARTAGRSPAAAEDDLLGWRDRRAPLSAYVVLELEDVPTCVRLRASDAVREQILARRVTGLRARSERFVREVLRTRRHVP